MQRWLVTSFIIIAGLMALIVADQYLRTQTDEHNDELLETRLQFAATRFEQAIRQRIGIIEDIAALSLIDGQGEDERRFGKVVRSLRGGDPAIQGVARVNREGEVRYYFPTTDDETLVRVVGEQIAEGALFEKGRRLARTVTANPVNTRGDRRLMTVAVPLFHGGEFRGFMIGVLDLTVLIKSILEIGQEGIGFQIKDADGRLFYSVTFTTDAVRTYEMKVADTWWVLSDGWSGRPPAPDATIRGMLWLLGALLILVTAAYVNRRLDDAQGLSQVIASRLHALREETRKLGQSLNGQFNGSARQAGSRQRQDALLEKRIPVGLFHADAEGKLTLVNERWGEITGMGEEKALGRPWYEAVAEPDREKVCRDWQDATKAGRTYNGEVRIMRPGGEQRWVLVQAVPASQENHGTESYIGACTDITAQKASADAVMSSEEELRTLLKGMQDTYFRTDAHGRIVRISESVRKLLGYEAGEMTGMPVYRLCLHARDRRQLIGLLGQKGAAITDYELQLKKRDGHPVWVSLNARFCDQGDSGGSGIEGSVRDISARKKIESRFLELTRSLETSSEAALVTSPEFIVEYVNPAYERMSGYRRDELLGREIDLTESSQGRPERHRKIMRALMAGKRYRGTFVNFHANGSLFYEERTISPIRDGQGRITHVVATSRDVTAQIHHHKGNGEMVREGCEPCGKLPGRQAFMELLEKSLERARLHQHFVAVMLIDLEKPRVSSDGNGRDMEDCVVQAFLQRLGDAVRDEDVVACFDSGEYAVLLDDISKVNHISIIARKVVTTITPPVELDQQRINLNTSIGISVYPEDGENGEALVKNARSALQRARKLGRNKYQFSSADMSARILARRTMEEGLRHALARNEFILHYQPQLDIHTNQVVGAEALLRWQHPELGLLFPGDFVPLLEETGLIETVGEWVLEQSFAQAHAWHRSGFTNLRITVNLSNRQFNDPGFITKIEGIIQRTGIEPALLELELTESVIMRNTRAANAALDSLDAMGVKFSIDDFGTGYSSLYYLKRFPVDTLKIDRSFISDVTSNPDDAAIVSAIIGMGHNMKLKVIAEGVENHEQMAFLRAHDCDIIQGFLFSQPLLPAGMTRVLREKSVLH
ncbi:MAG TPA: EAL domain-containing protein [Gammaproteobacteria bacterium]|nr:EAL domain-containing protein [Gammaproteobacteria bacterium]